MKITVYVLGRLQNGKRYVGITNHLQRRLQEHRQRSTKCGQLLGEFFVLHTEEEQGYPEARKREKYLKSGQGREWLMTKYPKG